MFTRHKKDNLIYYTIPSFDKTKMVKHCFSTKKGGVSTGEYESLNLGLYLKDSEENVKNNFQILCEAINVNPNHLFFSHQIHEDTIHEVTEEEMKNHHFGKISVNHVDGFITNVPNVALTTFYADCVPLYFLDSVKKAIGLSHAGWKGTVIEIGKKTVQKMVKRYGCKPEDILVGIGPSIGKCCFEVENNVVESFEKNYRNLDFIKKKNSEKYHVDLWQANKISLLEAGIPEKNITSSSICTMCNKDEFFSHRGTGGKRGSLAAILQLI